MILDHLSRKVELSASCGIIAVAGRVQYELWALHGRVAAKNEVVCEDVMRCRASLHLV